MMDDFVVWISTSPSNRVTVKAHDTWDAARRAVKLVFLACRNDVIEVNVGAPNSCRVYRKLFRVDAEGNLS